MDIIELIGQLLVDIAPDVPVYQENQKGGFKEPSFYVSGIGAQSKPEFFDRQKRIHGNQVVYFPNPSKPNQDMAAMEQRLLDQFKTLPGFAHIRDRNFSRSDGALTVDFNVVLWAQPVDSTTKFGNMEYHGVIAYGNDEV